MNNFFSKIKAFFEKVPKVFAKLTVKRFSNKEKIFLLLLFIAFAFVENYLLDKWIKALKTQRMISEKYPAKPVILIPTPAGTSTNTPFAAAPQPAKNKEPVKKEKKPDSRDPFLPRIEQSEQNTSYTAKQFLSEHKLSGILFDDNGPTAIINSKVIRIGDIISGKTVVDIEKNKVILMENGEILILELKKNN